MGSANGPFACLDFGQVSSMEDSIVFMLALVLHGSEQDALELHHTLRKEVWRLIDSTFSEHGRFGVTDQG